MAQSVLAKKRNLRSELKISDEMKDQLRAIAATTTKRGKQETLDVLTVDMGDAIPEMIVMWEKSSCC